MRAATALVVASVTTWSCAPPSPTYPTPVQPQHGIAAIIDLTAATAGSGPVSLAIGVMDAYRAPVQTTVELQASAGSLSASSVTTNSDGRASASLTAPAGTLTVTARAGTAEGHTLVTIAPTVVLPPVTPPIPPQPPPVQTPDPLPPLTVEIRSDLRLPGFLSYFGLRTQPVTQVTWNFGDGIQITTTTPTVAHQFNASGPYEVIAVVQDIYGRTAWTSTVITIPKTPGT